MGVHVHRWFVVGLSAMGLRGMRLGFAKQRLADKCTFVKAVQPTPTMNTRSLSATIVRDGCECSGRYIHWTNRLIDTWS